MPEEKIRQIMASQTTAEAAQMATIECLRALADGNKKVASVLEGVQAEVRDVRERLIRIEAAEFKGSLEKVDGRITDSCAHLTHELQGVRERVDVLEAAEDRRAGERSAANWLFKNWPGIIAWLALAAVVLFANGKVQM